jgi:hypothetical protein
MEPRQQPEVGALLEDYKLKVDFALNQINRLQNQFQLLLTIEAAVATALIVTKSGALSDSAAWIALLEAGLSIGWLIVGWIGRSRAIAYRRDLEDVGYAWASAVGMDSSWRPVGSGHQILRGSRGADGYHARVGNVASGAPGLADQLRAYGSAACRQLDSPTTDVDVIRISNICDLVGGRPLRLFGGDQRFASAPPRLRTSGPPHLRASAPLRH